MRRISLALALVSAVAVTGCGGGAKPASGGGKGTAGVDFDVKVNNQGAGTVTANPGALVCAANTTCDWTFAAGTTVTLTATADAGIYFNGWFGDCQGTAGCTLKGDASKYVVSYFSATPQAHPNLTDPKLHDPAVAAAARGVAGSLKCTDCHGASLQGTGLAVACANCHASYQVAKFVSVLSGTALAANENCSSCHQGDGAYHQSIYNKFTDASKLVATIGDVSSVLNADGTYTVTVNFSLTKNGSAYAATISTFGQKTVYATAFNPETGKFDQTLQLSKLAAGTTAGTYTATNTNDPTKPLTIGHFAPETSNAFVYAYFAENPTIIPNAKNYKIYDNVASAAKQFNAVTTSPWSYTSSANVAGCQKCHPTPYMKHGYRAAAVPGIPDMVACKSCHYDTREGEDFVFQLVYDDINTAANLTVVDGEKVYPAEVLTKYAYYATVMNDTHMAHSGEIAYPQSMANCATCHEGKLDTILADSNFNGLVCKSCHPTTALTDAGAPSFANPTGLGAKLGYHTFNWANGTIISYGVEKACVACHADNIADDGSVIPDSDPAAHDGVGPTQYGNIVPLFKDIHRGYDKAIYADSIGTKYASQMKTTTSAASFDSATNKVTVTFDVSNVPADATIKPTVTASLYGYDTKDFLVSGHSSQFADKTPNLEWSEGAVVRGTTTPANTDRLTVSPATASAGVATWTAVIDLSTWSAKLADGSVKRIEIGFLPNATIGADTTAIAIGGLSVTYDLVNNLVVDNTAGKGTGAIVDSAKCNNCHDALATTFHSPAYGSAGVVGCRLCHFPGSGASHLEMQSRSIDSYVHALHSFQYMDIKNVNFADATNVSQFEYEEHIGQRYPMFTTLDCESCHNPGTYEPSDVTKSLPGILSASATLTGKTRAIGTVASVVSGPSSKACGGCHRATMINEDDASKLGWFDAHTGAWGYRDAPDATNTTTTAVWGVDIDKLF